jgi:hypothetical protein
VLLVADLPPYASTIAGAMAPVLTALLFIPVRRLARKLEGSHKDTIEGQQEIRLEQAETNKRLAEAEALIRGDLKNGIKASLDKIDAKVTEVNKRQGQSQAENK